MPYSSPETLEAFLDCHHVPICIEFDGSKREHIFSACVPGMKVARLGQEEPSFIGVRSTTPATVVSVLARALEDEMLQDDHEMKWVRFPKVLEASSLVQKLEPGTEAEMLALQYVTGIATRMGVHFSIKREAYDGRWVATMDVSVMDLERQRLIPVSVGNDLPMLALKEMARLLCGGLLSREGQEFRAPVMPSVHLTMQESILARKFRDENESLTEARGEAPAPPSSHPTTESDREAGAHSYESQKP